MLLMSVTVNSRVDNRRLWAVFRHAASGSFRYEAFVLLLRQLLLLLLLLLHAVGDLLR